MNELLTVSQPPHIRIHNSTRLVMFDVVIAMLPILAAAVYYFGPRAMVITLAAVISSVIFEFTCATVMHMPLTVKDGSAIVSGMLLAFNLPVSVPIWIPIVGSLFMIVIVKMCFGGLGQNIVNPALAGRAFLMASWPSLMTRFTEPFTRISTFGAVDAVSAATPLSVIKGLSEGVVPGYYDLFIGNTGGVIGEVSKVAIIIGAAYLFIRKVITWHAPVCCVVTVAVLSYIFGAEGYFTGDWLTQILTGGLLLGAFFMATDYTTTPITRKGMMIFGVGCGLLTVFIRKFGGYPEGMSYSILLMNVATPLIDKWVGSRRFGVDKKRKGVAKHA